MNRRKRFEANSQVLVGSHGTPRPDDSRIGGGDGVGGSDHTFLHSNRGPNMIAVGNAAQHPKPKKADAAGAAANARPPPPRAEAPRASVTGMDFSINPLFHGQLLGSPWSLDLLVYSASFLILRNPYRTNESSLLSAHHPQQPPFPRTTPCR
jgi:hypothetical protein